MIEVRHLFGNMPARKKFLKSQRTELNHIEEVVKNQALAHPHIGFSLQIDGRVSLEYHPDADLEKRTREVFRYSGSLLELQAEEDCQGSVLKVDGYLLLPETGSLASARLRILVNDRPVQDAMIRHAVNEGMQGFLMRGYQPAGILRLSISPDQVDVNVHPAKREIRFRRAEVVHRFVAEQVAQAMQEYQQTLRSTIFSTPALPQRENWTDGQPRVPLPDPVPAPLMGTAEPLAPEFQSRPRTVTAGTPLPLARTLSTQTPLIVTRAELQPATLPSGDDFSGLTLIGQLFSLYLLAERDGQFLVIDQHAAHERLLYGQLRQGYLAANIPRQALMFPSTVELSPAQTETLERKAAAVIALGLEAELFGEATAVVHSVPAAISHVDPGALLREVLDSLRGQADGARDRGIPQAADDLLASMACKAAIKAGNRLQPVEMLKLLQQMQASEVFSHCPHGRPVIKTFTAQEVERWFHRHGG